MPARSTMTSSRPRRRSCSQSRQCVQKSRPLEPQICSSNGARLVICTTRNVLGRSDLLRDA
eukprot:scaffold2168_cov81-Phaeocystis_antarctica.AAC.2